MKDILYGWGMACLLISHFSVYAWIDDMFFVFGIGLLWYSYYLANKTVKKKVKRYGRIHRTGGGYADTNDKRIREDGW